VDVDSFAHWPPAAATLNPIDNDPLEFVLTRNLLRDEQFCFANTGNPDPFCQRLYSVVGMAGEGLPQLWTGTSLTLQDLNSPYGTWVERTFLDNSLLELVDEHVEDFEGFFYPDSGIGAVGWRDETQVRFEPFEEFDWPCVWMTVEVPFFASGTGEPVEVTLDENGSQTLQLSLPGFEAEMTAEYLACWAGSYLDPGSLLPSLEEGITVIPWTFDVPWSVDTRGVRTHPDRGRTIVTGGTGTAALQAEIDQALEDDDIDPVPFLAAALSVPLQELAEDWADQAGPFIGLYAKRVNNRVGEDTDTGNEAIAAIAGVTPKWDETSDCTRWDGSLAGLSVVLGDVADQTWAIGGTLSSLQGRNLGSVDYPASWVNLDSESMEDHVTRLDWLRDFYATLRLDDNEDLFHPLDDSEDENVRVLLSDLVSGLLDSSVPPYNGESCEARWGDPNDEESLASDVWNGCLEAVDENQAPNEQQLCEYYLHEVAVAFYDTCAQPSAMEIDGKCAGFAPFEPAGWPHVEVSGFEFDTGELRWDQVSQDYYDTYLGGGGGGCSCGGSDFQTTDSFVWDPPSPYLTREHVDTDGDRFEDSYLNYLRVPAWITLRMDISAQLRIKVESGCSEHDTPNEGKIVAYEDRMADLDAFRGSPFDGELPSGLQGEHDRLTEWLDDNDLVQWSDPGLMDTWQANVDLLDDANYWVFIDGGELEILLGVEWGFPLVEEQAWEWMAQRWANNVLPSPSDEGAFVLASNLTTADVSLSVDGLCLYLDRNEQDVVALGGLANAALENALYNLSEAPCAAALGLLGADFDLDSAMGLSLPIPFLENQYWQESRDALENGYVLATAAEMQRNAVTSSLQSIYEDGRTGSSVEPPLIAALTTPEYSIREWPLDMLVFAKPATVAVHPRMLLMDEIWREGFYSVDGDLSHDWTMDELFVSSVSYGTRYEWTPADGSLWTGPAVPAHTGHLSWYALQPQFDSYPNESLATIYDEADEVDAQWLDYAGQPLFSVLDDANLFDFGSDWSPHSDPLQGMERMPAWCPGRPHGQLPQP